MPMPNKVEAIHVAGQTTQSIGSGENLLSDSTNAQGVAGGDQVELFSVFSLPERLAIQRIGKGTV